MLPVYIQYLTPQIQQLYKTYPPLHPSVYYTNNFLFFSLSRNRLIDALM